MRSSMRLFVAASVAAAGLSLAGCNQYKVPQKDMPGGILSGNEYTRTRTTRGTPLENQPSDRVAGNTTGGGAPEVPSEARPRTGPAGTGLPSTNPSASGASATVAPEPMVQPAPTTPPRVPPSATPNPAAPAAGPSNGASPNNTPAPGPQRVPPSGETGTTGAGAGTTAPPVSGGVTGGNNNQSQ